MLFNLKEHNVTDLRFAAEIILTDDLIAEIHLLSKPDSDGGSVFSESYEKHKAFVWVTKADEKTFQSKVFFNYETKRTSKPKEIPSRIEELIHILSRTNQQLTFDCRASFHFAKNLHMKSIIHLPQRYLEMPDMPFDRIQGMHFVKLDGSETKYDVILESPTQGILIENVIFKYSSIIDNSLASNIFAEAIKISDNFVFKE